MSNKIYKEMTDEELKKKLFDSKSDFQKMVPGLPMMKLAYTLFQRLIINYLP